MRMKLNEKELLLTGESSIDTRDVIGEETSNIGQVRSSYRWGYISTYHSDPEVDQDLHGCRMCPLRGSIVVARGARTRFWPDIAESKGGKHVIERAQRYFTYARGPWSSSLYNTLGSRPCPDMNGSEQRNETTRLVMLTSWSPRFEGDGIDESTEYNNPAAGSDDQYLINNHVRVYTHQ